MSRITRDSEDQNLILGDLAGSRVAKVRAQVLSTKLAVNDTALFSSGLSAVYRVDSCPEFPVEFLSIHLSFPS